MEVETALLEGGLSLIAVPMRYQGKFAGTPHSCERKARVVRLSENRPGLHRHRFLCVGNPLAEPPRSLLFEARTSPRPR